MKRRCGWLVVLLMVVGAAGRGQAGQPKTGPEKKTPGPDYGQTVFSRSDGSGSDGFSSASARKDGSGSASSPGQTAGQSAGNAPAAGAGKPAAAALVSNAERTSLTYSAYDFEIHLEPAEHRISVHAHLTARNTGGKPLARIALQLSSALQWYSIGVDGRAAKFETEEVESDIDHTGKLTEAVVALGTPVPVGGTVGLDVIYSGAIQQSAERLVRLGAPEKIAASSEWDRIGSDFTALRGFGNVIWFPVSTAPVLLGEGARMFDEVGKWKLRESGARVSMKVLAEYVEAAPTMAFLNGEVVGPDASSPDSASAGGKDVPRVISFTLRSSRLGFSPLSLIMVMAGHEHFPGLDAYTRLGNSAAADAYEKIAEQDRPLIEQWLGQRAKRPVVLIDLPEGDDLPYEERNLLLLPMHADAASDSAGPVLAHMLSHAYFISARPWLDEGVAQLMTLFWIEQRAGRATAIGQMESRRAALALAEPADPGSSGAGAGQSLIEAWSDIYYRDKAADVLWMLRDMTGDAALAQALEGYRSAKDSEASYLQRLLEKTSGKDLEWFFDDWVYRDRGLPDLHIASAYRRPILTKNSAVGNFLVSVDVENDSFCSAEVPVTVESGSTSQSKRLRVPSHTRAALRMLVDAAPTRVKVNDGSVPEVRTSHHEKAVIPAQ